MTRDRAIIAAARRSPIGRLGGSLRNLTVEALAAPVLRTLLEEVRLEPGDVDDVLLGNAAGPGGNPARVAALEAGFPVSVPGVTIDRQCGSGLEAINMAARLVEAGAGEVFIAGGVESASTAPWRVEKPRSLYQSPRFFDRARFAPEAVGDPDMGVAAENVARAYGITRPRQDAYALRSHEKAVASIRSGRFRRELVPVSAADDELPRGGLKPETLARMPPAFVENGTVTAGNSCQVSDGAAAVVVLSERRFRAMGLTRGLLVVDSAASGVDPNLLGTGPVAAVRRLLARRTDVRLEDVDLVEFNEAFAAQVLACLEALGIPEEKVNVGGGALALGHPYGASGAVLVTRLFTELVAAATPAFTGRRRGLATLGIGGGLGVASLFETVP